MAKMLSAHSNMSDAEGAIGKRGAAAVKKIRADGRERRLSAGRRTAFCSLGHVSLASHSRHLSL